MCGLKSSFALCEAQSIINPEFLHTDGENEIQQKGGLSRPAFGSDLNTLIDVKLEVF